MDDNSNIHGIKISRGAPIVSHLLYVDDILVACQADSQNAQEVDKMLKTFSLWSGQTQIRKNHKSFSLNIPLGE